MKYTKPFLVLIVLCFSYSVSNGQTDFVDFDDEQHHIIDDSRYINNTIRLFDTAHLEILDNAVIGYNLYLLLNATVDMSGGTIGGALVAYHDTRASITGGSLYNIISAQNASINLSGGTVQRLTGYDGTIFLHGNSFEFTENDITTQLFLGDKLSDYSASQGQLSGILADGSTLDIDYLLYDGDIVIIPEPVTLSLLTLGGLTILQRKRKQN